MIAFSATIVTPHSYRCTLQTFIDYYFWKNSVSNLKISITAHHYLQCDCELYFSLLHGLKYDRLIILYSLISVRADSGTRFAGSVFA